MEVDMNSRAATSIGVSLTLAVAAALGAWGSAGAALASQATLEDRITAVYESAGPSVVNITGLTYVRNPLLGSVPEEGTGSGFVFDGQGHIVTNYHVIEGTYELIVTLATGEEFLAEIVGVDPANDLAVLRIDAGAKLPPALDLADSDALRVGQFVVAIGAPFGLEQTLTTGVVSALGRVIESPEDDQFIGEAIQTDAAINPGNSGGPLLNLNGEVIGVNCQILSTSGSSAGVGFAISANTVARVVPRLILDGQYPHPWIGIQTIDLNAYTLAVLKQVGAQISVSEGALVVGFESGSPARAAGVNGGSRTVRYGWYAIPIGGDVLVAVDDRPIEKMEDLLVYLETETEIGDTVRLTVVRDGSLRTIEVRVAERPTGR